YDSPHGGAIDCAALQRSTGSLLKPFIYAMGLEWLGYTSSTVLTDLGFDFGTGRNSYIPENFDRKFQGPVLYKNALANSRNIPSIEVLKALGVPMFYDKCIALGLTEDNGLANYYGLGLSIGGLYCSLQQICEAYLCLADNGRKRHLVWDYSHNGDSLVVRRQIIEPDIAQQIKRYLSDPVARLPSFPRGGTMEFPFAVAVKTGTSEGFRDSWCCAISDTYVVGVWAGNTDFSQTKNLSGYEGSAAVVKKMMMYLHKDKVDGLNDIQFQPPEHYIPVEICKLTGKKADKFTPYTTTEYFKPGTEPVEFSSVQQMVAVDKRNKLPLTPGCNVPSELRRFIVLDAQYQEWAKTQGLEILPDRFSPYCNDFAIVDNYEIKIVSPKSNSRFYIDPEMPDGTSVIKIKCTVVPSPKSVIWFVNDEEYMETAYPYQLSWKMQKGKYSLYAKVTGTGIRSDAVIIEVY
ncbi:MAG: penicillin-binding transpeptidase domain-containing protein, partial [Fibrobacterota bacterium]